MCLEECKPVLLEIFKHPCFSPELLSLFRGWSLETDDQTAKTQLYEYYYRLDSCAAELEREKCHGNGGGGWTEPGISGNQRLSSTLAVMIVSLLLYFC